MDATATFTFSDFNVDPKNLQCKNNEKMGQIFTRFSAKENICLKDYEFYYHNKKINNDSTIVEIKDKKDAVHITIVVKKRTKINKCQKCVCNNCIIKIEDYKLKFSECRYGHVDAETLDNYEKSQKIDYEKIKCDNNRCEKTQRDDLRDFVKCLDCSNVIGQARYYCKDCSESRRCEGCDVTHKMIEYSEKYYYCPDHFSEFKYYCDNCNANCCETCLNEKHNKHTCKKFESMTPDIKSIKYQIEKISKKIKELQIIVSHMKNSLDRAVNIFSKYQDIALDILGKYESYNTNLKNYQVLKTISNLIDSNKTVLEDLDEIITTKKDENILIVQFAKLIGIYEGNRRIFKNIVFQNSDEPEYIKESIHSEGNSNPKNLKNNNGQTKTKVEKNTRSNSPNNNNNTGKKKK